MKIFTKKRIFFYLLIFVVLAIDLISKWLIYGLNVSLISGLLSIKSAANTGGAWSLFSAHTWLLIVTTIIFLVVLLAVDIKSKENNNLYLLAYSLIFGGALGNLVDRLSLGYVRDFISLDFINFPIFNIADICLCIGVIMYCIYILFIRKSENI